MTLVLTEPCVRDDSLALCFRDLQRRVVTGPLAFLVAGVVDVLAFVSASLWFRVRRVRRGRTAAG